MNPTAHGAAEHLVLSQQASRLNGLAMLAISDPDTAHQQFNTVLPLRGLHPSLVWMWHVVFHFSRRHQLLESNRARGPGQGGSSFGYAEVDV